MRLLGVKYLCSLRLGGDDSAGVAGAGLDDASSDCGRRRGVSFGSFFERSGGLLGTWEPEMDNAEGILGGKMRNVLVYGLPF